MIQILRRRTTSTAVFRALAWLAPTTTCTEKGRGKRCQEPFQRSGNPAGGSACRQVFPASRVPVCPGPNKLSYRASGLAGRLRGVGGAAGRSWVVWAAGNHPGRDWSCARFYVKLTVARQGIIRANRESRSGSRSRAISRTTRSTSACRKHELSTAHGEVPPWCSSPCSSCGDRRHSEHENTERRNSAPQKFPGDRIPDDGVPDDSVRAQRIFAWGCPCAPAQRAKRLVVCV